MRCFADARTITASVGAAQRRGRRGGEGQRGRWTSVVTSFLVLVSALVVTEAGTTAAAAVRGAAATGVDAATAAGRDLLAYVPTSFRRRCTDLSSTFDDQSYLQAVVTTFVNSLSCSTAAGERVYYWKFDDRAGADAFLETLVTVANYA